ncbi:MAG: hypothetical protein AB8E82_16195 [Aureispira sp.]
MYNYLLCLLASALLLGACQKDGIVAKNTSLTLTGDWYMTDYQAFTLQPIPISYGDIRWSFDSTAQTITIQNNTNVLNPSGTYSYTQTATELTVVFPTYSQTFDYSFASGTLILSDHPELDGPVITFNR